ncbi:scoloptoxin SSD14 [Teleopsis dalmanni]|uniref:scoloptoxin SSD14 n=1 Tax=Teleopsis dalmanni TaxID=139649 RepID=UPI0018CEACC1|nr:scoloptoxin SSD14 [Teleopsis dalmanni]
MIAMHLFLLLCCLCFMLMALLVQQRLNFLKQFFKSSKLKTYESSSLIPPNPIVPQLPSVSIMHIYEKAAVCSDGPICSIIGSEVLKVGGSAVDAAIAASICQGLVGMQSMGIGGGLLMNVYIAEEKRSYSITSREVAPLGASESMLNNASAEFHSSLSIGVPGEVMGYAVAYERFGKLRWKNIVAPTVEICNAGFLVTEHLDFALEINKDKIMNDKQLREVFVNPKTNELLQIGEYLKPPDALCRTLEYISNKGARSFYEGVLADDIIADLKEFNSIITKKDLSSYKTDITSSTTFPLGAHILHFMPPPASGYIIGFVMKILQNFQSDFARKRKMDAILIHRVVEALKFGFVKRWQLDADMSLELLSNLSSPVYTEKLASLIDDIDTYNDSQHYGADEELIGRKERGTAHISVVAPNGDAVSITSSINFYFGSGHCGNRTGIIFNNAMHDFNIEGIDNYFKLPNIPKKNRIKPGKSPMSSMSPLIVTTLNGEVRLVIGAAGGTKIISALVQILIRVLWFDENIKEAIDAARFHHQLIPNVLEYEYGILNQFIQELEEKGHKTDRYREHGSAVCGVERFRNKVVANADYRKEGEIEGF